MSNSPSYHIFEKFSSICLLAIVCLIASSAMAQPVTNNAQTGEVQIAALEQSYDSQVIQILSNHFDRKKFFVDVNIDASFITETFETPGNQVVNTPRQNNIFMPGLPFIPNEDLQDSQVANTQTPQSVLNQSSIKSMIINSIVVNIYADTSLTTTDLDFMRQVAGFAAKINVARGDLINITSLSIPNPAVQPTVVLTNEGPREDKPFIELMKDYIPEMVLLALFFVGLIINGVFNKPRGDSGFQSGRENLKGDINLDGTFNPSGNLVFDGTLSNQGDYADAAEEFEKVAKNLFKEPKEVSLVFEYWIDSDLKNGPMNVAEVISTVDQTSLKLLQHYLHDKKYELIREALIELKPMSIGEKYQAAKYFNSVMDNKGEVSKEGSTKKHAKLGLFKFLTHLTDNQLIELIKTENNISAALIIDYLNEEKAADILDTFERTRASEIILKVSMLHTLSYEEQSKISTDLFDKAISVRDSEHIEDHGLENIIPILENLPVKEQSKYIQQLKSTNYAVGTRLEKEFFTIEQIPELSEEVMKEALDSIDTTVLIDSLMGLDQKSIDKILASRPTREQKLVRMELENADNKDVYGDTGPAKKELVRSIRKAIKSKKENKES